MILPPDTKKRAKPFNFPSLGGGNKFGAVRCQLDGYTFDSKTEMKRYAFLRQRERAGEIQRLQVHPKFTLAIDGNPIRFVGSERALTYKADFAYIEDGEYIVEDVKNPLTAKKRDFRIIQALMRAIHGITVRVVK